MVMLLVYYIHIWAVSELLELDIEVVWAPQGVKVSGHSISL